MSHKNKKVIILLVAVFAGSGIFACREIGNLKNQKTAETAALGGLRLTQVHGLSSWKDYSISREFVDSFIIGNNEAVLENKKSAINADSLGLSNAASSSRLPSSKNYSMFNNFVKGNAFKQKTVEVMGFAPLDSWMAIPSLHYITPTANLLYHKNQKSKTASCETILKRGGEQGSRTPFSFKRIVCVSNNGASTSAILSVFHRFNNYIINIFSSQNKNISNNNEDVFVDSLVENRVPLSDTHVQYNRLKKFVKSSEIKKMRIGDLARKIFGVKEARAQSVFDGINQSISNTDDFSQYYMPPGSGAAVMDIGTQMRINAQITQDLKQKNKDWVTKLKEQSFKMLNMEIIRSAIRNFSQQFAYQSAIKITEGGPGGEGLNWSQPYGEYLEDAALAAAGDYIGSLSEIWGVNLCDPGTLGKLELTLGLITSVSTSPKPRCDWKDIESNWREMDENEFLKKLSFSFDPDVNYLGSSFALQQQLQEQSQRKRNAAELVRGIPTSTGFKDFNEAVSGWTKTPSSMVKKYAEEPVEIGREGWSVSMIGDIFAADVLRPAATTFLSTLAGKLIEKWLVKGMFNPSAYDLANKWNIINNPEGAGSGAPSKSALRDEYSEYTKPSFEPGGNRDILSELSICPSAINPGPTNCIIDTNFRMAIEKKATVGDAIKEGYLNPSWNFGFSAKDMEPAYNEGYSLRGMRVLRRYRILPVGWEIAAEYINNFASGREKTVYNLMELIDCYDDRDDWNSTGTKDEWCRGLVDPDWLLKSPANYCEDYAYGQEIVSEQFMGSIGDQPSQRIISRNKFCAGDKSCLKESDKGDCLKWGYCAEEKNIWRFKGDSCDEKFNTCQTFTRMDANEKANEREYSYLKNTLDYGICDAANAGCGWYCASGEWDAASSTVEWCGVEPMEKSPLPPLWERGELRVFFDRDAESCDEEYEGCHEYIPFVGNTNLIYNGDFTYGGEDLYIEGLEGREGIDGKDAAEIAEKIRAAREAAADNKFNYWPAQGEDIKISLDNGAAKIEASGAGAGIYSYEAVDAQKKNESVMPLGFNFDFNKSYVLFADIKVEAGSAEIGFDGAATVSVKVSPSSDFQRLEVILEAGNMAADRIFIRSAGDGDNVFYVDNIFLSEYADSTRITTQNLRGYADYGNGAVYIKKAPEYLGCGNLTSADRLAQCSKYAAECEEYEVGCSKYTPVNGDPWVPAIISEEDICDAECLNYKSYRQSATNFSKEIFDVRFIAESPYSGAGNVNIGEVCEAEAAGCAEFTNLDELEKGGEAREYYTELKQCVKTDGDGAPITGQGEVCATFYTWIGSDTAGYQLKTYYIQKSANGSPYEIPNPRDFGRCAGPDDAKNNPHCREFYNEAGAVFYTIAQRTASCGENCHPYRKTAENINQSACSIYGSEWLSAGNHTIAGKSVALSKTACKLEVENCLYSGGSWINNECVYMAIPEEGIACEAKDVGCNKYEGAASANVRRILNDDFEDKTNNGWTGGSPSNEAIIGKQSLTAAVVNESVAIEIQKDFATSSLDIILNRDKIYNISFWALNRAATNAKLEIIFEGDDFYATRKATIPYGEWKEIKNIGNIVLGGDLDNNGAGNGQLSASDLAILINAASNPMSVTARQRELADINGDGVIDGVAGASDKAGTDGKLLADFIAAISGKTIGQSVKIKGMNANIFLDNIVIKEIQGDIYRIKDSWSVPVKCDLPVSQLGCSEYEDLKGNKVFLKEFNNTCSSNAIGCEKMIDTYNSSNMFGEDWDVSGNNPVQCSPQSPAGCGEAGEHGGNISVPRDQIVYFVNDSSKYCAGSAENPSAYKGCQRFGVPALNQDKTELAGFSGDIFIKNDPDRYDSIMCSVQANDCEEWGMPDSGGAMYFKDPADKVCENKNGIWYKASSTRAFVELCATTTDINLTIGNAVVDLPSNGWAGICPETESGCTEYIDPLSDNEPNLVINGNFEQDAQGLDDPNQADGPDYWDNVLGCAPRNGGASCAECCNGGIGGTKAIKKGRQKITGLIDKKLYTLSALAKGSGIISVTGCDISSPDDTMEISQSGGIITFSNAAAMEKISGRFYINKLADDKTCVLTADAEGGMVDEVKVQETGLYYYVKNTVEKGCAPGDNNCVLVNERELMWDSDNAAIKHSPLIYSAEKKGGAVCDGQKENCQNNANAFVKAEPDRICGKWLEEGNKSIDANGAARVHDLESCVAMAGNGECARTVLDAAANLNFSSENVSLMKNISGFSKAGFDWGNGRRIEGYYPVSAMREIGGYIEFNGGFEDFDAEKKPFGWEAENGKIEVVSNPVDAQGEGLDPRAPSGRSFLKLENNSIALAEEKLSVVENAEYVLSGYMNGYRIDTDAKIGIYVVAYNRDGAVIASPDLKIEIAQGKKQWMYAAKNVMMPDGAEHIRIKLMNNEVDSKGNIIKNGVVQGSSYFDEISLKPALKVQEFDGSFMSQAYTSSPFSTGGVGIVSGISPSVCKAYPAEDSFSCEYTGGNGIKYRGTRGYCLEYDRAPGDLSVCLSWYPIDVIRGEEVDTVPTVSFAGFGDGPLYYCLEGEFLESRKVIYLGDSGVGDGDQGASCDRNYFSCVNERSKQSHWCYPREEDFLSGFITFPVPGGGGGCDSWQWGRNTRDNPNNEEAWFYYDGLGRLNGAYSAPEWSYQEGFQLRCSKIVQVATANGESGIWAERLRPNSGYSVIGLYDPDTINPANNVRGSNYVYNTAPYNSNGTSATAPYGAIMPPAMVTVENWDGILDDAEKPETLGKQPLNIIWTWQNDIENNGMKYKFSHKNLFLPYSCDNTYANCEAPWGLKIDVKNNLKDAQDTLKQLFVKSYGVWEWQDGSKVGYDKAGYEKLGENAKLDYMKLTGDTPVQCPIGTIIPPAEDEVVITWTDDASKSDESTCWIAWKWKCAEWDRSHLFPICERWEYQRDNSYSFSSPDKIYLNPYKCANNETLKTTVENILTGKNGVNLRPQSEVFKEKKRDGAVCKEWTAVYNQAIEEIFESQSSDTEESVVDQQSEDSRSIYNTKRIGDNFYKYEINMSRNRISYTPGAPLPDNKECDKIKQIVKEGTTCKEITFEKDSVSAAWEPPKNLCPENSRTGNYYCAIKPEVKNVRVEGILNQDVNIGVTKNVKLAFNTAAEPNQQPLVGWQIDWGYGPEDIIERQRFRPQPNENNPHIKTHPYRYSEARPGCPSGNYNRQGCLSDGSGLCCFSADFKFSRSDKETFCQSKGASSDCCLAKPKIRIKDNWGWCNDGVENIPCPETKSGWAKFGGWIVMSRE